MMKSETFSRILTHSLGNMNISREQGFKQQESEKGLESLPEKMVSLETLTSSSEDSLSLPGCVCEAKTELKN